MAPCRSRRPNSIACHTAARSASGRARTACRLRIGRDARVSKNRQQADEPPDVAYYVSVGRGEDFILTVKANWKLTFGAVNPGGQVSGRDMHCLRVWEGEKLRAVFCDVRGFRDLSLPLARKISRETG